MLRDYNQINDINPFHPGETSSLPGTYSTDYDFANRRSVASTMEPAQEEVPPVCKNGEVRIGCNAVPHCPLDRPLIPSYTAEQGRWAASGARCGHKTILPSQQETFILLLALMAVVVVFYLNKE